MFLKFRAAPATAAAAPGPLARLLEQLEAPDPAAAAERSEPAGCGWFDSSYELGRGLLVTEYDGFEWLDDSLPLSDWLQ